MLGNVFNIYCQGQALQPGSVQGLGLAAMGSGSLLGFEFQSILGAEAFRDSAQL